jgi:hypothetical protein
MSLEAWGDEGSVPANGKDTAIYQQLCDLRRKLAVWQQRNKKDFENDAQVAKADRIFEAIDDLLDDLGN